MPTKLFQCQILLKNIIKIFYQMKTFRRKYIYNPDNPIYESSNVRTFNCMNTETKEKTLIILQHLKDVPFVQPSTSVLQPIQIPTESQPFSVYPIVRCVSEIGKLAQPEAMYVLKCIIQSKIKKPLYSVISKQQGIVTCNVQGVLPGKTPDLFQLAIDFLGLPSNLTEVDKSVVSKSGYSICRAIRQNDLGAVTYSLAQYGWKDIKKEKEQIYDEQFVVFKGRRKEQGSILNEEYGLAWHNQYGMCKMKHVSLVRDGYQEQFFNQFNELLDFIKQNQGSDNSPFLKVYKFSKDYKGIKIFSELANQGSMNQYIQKKHEMGKTLNEKNTLSILQKFIQSMAFISNKLRVKGLSTLHIKNLFVHNNRIVIGEPFLITDKAQKKLRDLKGSMDYYAPEFKENIILPENLSKMNREKTDIWSFGFILHKIYSRQVPIFDPSKKPIINKAISPPMGEFIKECLDITAGNRPSWSTIKLKDIQKRTLKVQEYHEQKIEKQQIRLGSRLDRRSQKLQKPKSPEKKLRIVDQYQEQRKVEKFSEEDKLKIEEQEEQISPPVPSQISSRLKKIKLILKIVIIMCLYIFVFFRPFFANSINILTVRSFYTTTTLHLVDYSSNRLSSTTVLTNNPLFFLQNDISFSDVQNQYHCIDDHFDPIYNPEYSLLSYLQSGDFLALLLTGWLTAIIICVLKAFSIWKGGISNRPSKNLCKYWVIYAFHELSLASLLFAHFYIYQFFYFSGATPCLSINNYASIQPFFDSTLYLFLSNGDGYFLQVFSTLGILSILITLSIMFYSCAPKLDLKYFISIPSILFRVVPFILFLLICRIGVFELFSPTAINDSTSIIPTIINNSFQGFIGIIPEIFILICIAIEALLELFMIWCQRKAAQNDKLAKLFNIRKKKIDRDESSIIEKSYDGLNDMSMINNSRHKLDISSIDQ